MRLLLIEDDECIAETLKNILSNQHYTIDVVADGHAGWELVEAFAYDLILLDVSLPKLDGVSLCRRLRSLDYQTPVLLITARNSTSDKVLGLDAGADDYVVKPFDITELLARIRALLRRRSSPILPFLKWGDLRLDPSTCDVTYNDRPLHLTPKEYRLLELFLRNCHHVFSRSAILDHLWSCEEAPREDTVTAHIKGLRHKMKQAGAPSDFIETVYGLGYRLKLPASPTPEPSPPTQSQVAQSNGKQKTIAALAEVWERVKSASSDRVAVLEQTAIALRAGTPSYGLWQQAQQAAHKLVGSLGVFGFAEGSSLAQKIEQILQGKVAANTKEASYLCDLIEALKLELLRNPSGQFSQPVAFHSRSFVLVIDDDAEFAEQIVRLSAVSGICLELVPNLSVAKDVFARHGQSAIANRGLDGVLLNFSFADDGADSLKLLAQLANQTPPIPILLYTTRDSLANRVKAAQFSVHTFLQKKLRPHQLVEVMKKLLDRMRAMTAKVMIVDDDPQVLTALQGLLEPWGVSLAALEQPSKFWKTLEEFSPDLLILDVEMPLFSGIELCQVVRNTPHWSNLPILFLTAHTDPDTTHRVFSAGANDCLAKSISNLELVNRLFGCLERVSLLQSMANMAVKT